MLWLAYNSCEFECITPIFMVNESFLVKLCLFCFIFSNLPYPVQGSPWFWEFLNKQLAYRFSEVSLCLYSTISSSLALTPLYICCTSLLYAPQSLLFSRHILPYIFNGIRLSYTFEYFGIVCYLAYLQDTVCEGGRVATAIGGECPMPPCHYDCVCERNKCLIPAEGGDCGSSPVKYFFNLKTQQCEEFVPCGFSYSGNVFYTKEECVGTCRGFLPCPVIDSCQTNCPNGYRINADGCVTCECFDPCLVSDVTLYSGELFMMLD